MNDVDNSVVLIARDASIVSVVASVARSQGLAVRHYESADSWLAEANGRPAHTFEVIPPAWIGCVVCHTALDEPELSPELTHICKLRRGLPVILISGAASVPGAVAAMQAGATTVLPHPTPEDQLADSLRIAVEKAKHLRPPLIRSTEAARRLAELSDGEREVLDELMAGLANKEIAHKLELGLRTVELRRSRITKKMKARSIAELVRLVCEARGAVVQEG
jgi:two-component system response regulator FixJ